MLKEIILKNIKAFPVSEFCSDGGWPKFDNLHVIVFSEVKTEDAVVYDLELVYDCEKAGCCFIPGADNHTRLRKKIKISESSFEVLD